MRAGARLLWLDGPAGASPGSKRAKDSVTVFDGQAGESEGVRVLLVLVTVLTAVLPGHAWGQAREGLELYSGPGFFWSPSGRQPSLPAIEVGGTYWFGPRWGVGGTFGFGTNNEEFEEARPGGRVGWGKLRFRQFMIERRVAVSQRWDLLLGVGFLGALHTDDLRLGDSSPPTEISDERGFGYVNFQVLARWRIHRYYGLRTGVYVSGPLVVRAIAVASFELW